MTTIKSVCVFCGSMPGTDPAFAGAIGDFGRELAGRGIRLVYGGGKVGLMGLVADAALEAGGGVLGVIPEGLLQQEIGHGGVTELRVVTTMHERKALMYEQSDAFVVFPGGYGTLDELLEITTWRQLGLHVKPIVLVNVRGAFDPLVEMIARMAANGFVRPAHRDLIQVVPNGRAALDFLAGFRPGPVAPITWGAADASAANLNGNGARGLAEPGV